MHKVHEKDQQLEANLKVSPKLTSKVLHPGNCKQNVSVALSIFDKTTSAGIKYFFPNKTDAAEFLDLLNIWWVVSNSKQKNNSNYFLGNAAVNGDKKPEFLRALANWIEEWDAMQLPNCERFCLSAQTSFALRRTL